MQRVKYLSEGSDSASAGQKHCFVDDSDGEVVPSVAVRLPEKLKDGDASVFDTSRVTLVLPRPVTVADGALSLRDVVAAIVPESVPRDVSEADATAVVEYEASAVALPDASREDDSESDAIDGVSS